MKIRSAKQKGRRAALEVQELLLAHSDLHKDDVHVTSSSVAGRDITLANRAQEIFPFAIEVKNVEKLNVREAYEQAKGYARDWEVPVLFHTRNRDTMLVTLSAKDFLQLVTKQTNAEADGARLGQAKDVAVQAAGESKGHRV